MNFFSNVWKFLKLCMVYFHLFFGVLFFSFGFGLNRNGFFRESLFFYCLFFLSVIILILLNPLSKMSSRKILLLFSCFCFITFISYNLNTSFFVARVTGDSMDFGEDIVLISRNFKIDSGSIYVFNDSEDLVIHRFVGFDSDGLLIFRGDNNNMSDEPVRKEQVIGKYLCNLENVFLCVNKGKEVKNK